MQKEAEYWRHLYSGLRPLPKSYKGRCHRVHKKVSTLILALRTTSVGTHVKDYVL